MHAVPVAEAALILGVAEGTIKSRCARGRAALAQHLGLTTESQPPLCRDPVLSNQPRSSFLVHAGRGPLPTNTRRWLLTTFDRKEL